MGVVPPFVAAGLLAVLLMLATPGSAVAPYMVFLAAAWALVGFSPLIRGERLRAAWAGVSAAFVLLMARALALDFLAGLRNPRDFDFPTFWLYGRVGVSGDPIYETASFVRHGLPIPATPTLQAETLDVGFPYPPHAMLVFGPLGLADFETAYWIWHGLLALGFAALVPRLARLMGSERLDLLGALSLGVLVLYLPATRQIFSLGQTTALALLFVLIHVTARSSVVRGLGLALAFVVKPFICALGLALLLRRAHRDAASAVAWFGVLSLLTIAIFGWENFAAFFSERAAGRFPEFVFTQPMNQSLLSTILHATGEGLGGLTRPTTVVLGLLSTAICALTLVSARPTQPGPRWVGTAFAVLAATLLLYPLSHQHYTVLLLAPILWLAARADLHAGVVALVACGYGLAAQFPQYQFWATALVWAATCWAAWRENAPPIAGEMDR